MAPRLMLCVLFLLMPLVPADLTCPVVTESVFQIQGQDWETATLHAPEVECPGAWIYDIPASQGGRVIAFEFVSVRRCAAEICPTAENLTFSVWRRGGSASRSCDDQNGDWLSKVAEVQIAASSLAEGHQVFYPPQPGLFLEQGDYFGLQDSEHWTLASTEIGPQAYVDSTTFKPGRFSALAGGRANAAGLPFRAFVDADQPARDCDLCLLSASTTKDGYTYEVWRGRHAEMWIDKDYAHHFSIAQISAFIVLASIMHESYARLFGWEFRPETTEYGMESRRHYVHSRFGGAGTGSAGMGWGLGYFGVSKQNDRHYSSNSWITTLTHEAIHMWDFRGGFWLNGDSAHSFTGGFEPIANEMLVNFEHLEGAGPLPPGFQIKRAERRTWWRYIDDPTSSWNSFFSDANHSKCGHWSTVCTDQLTQQCKCQWNDGGCSCEVSKPLDNERLLVQSAVFLHIYRMHGLSALQKIFKVLECKRLKDCLQDSAFPSNLKRTEHLIRVFAEGLQLNVAPYFEYWKFPVSQDLKAELAQWDSPATLLDKDGDGWSPLQGDWDDSNHLMFPGAEETPGNGIDENQDGLVDENVYDETTADFPDTDAAAKSIALPALIRGSTSGNAGMDIDAFSFDMQQHGYVTFVLTAGPAARVCAVTTSTGATQKIMGFTGQIKVDGSTTMGTLHIHSICAVTKFLAKGSHVVAVSHQFTNPPCAGQYELQLYVQTAALNAAELMENGMRYRPPTYYGLQANPGFTCDNVQGVSQGECAGLVQLFLDMQGSEWASSLGWLTSEDVCFWQGVRCNRRGIDRLELSPAMIGDKVLPSTAQAALDAVDWCAFSALTQLYLTLTFSSSKLLLPPAIANLQLKVFFTSWQACSPNIAFQNWYQSIADTYPWTSSSPSLCSEQREVAPPCSSTATAPDYHVCGACKYHTRKLSDGWSLFDYAGKCTEAAPAPAPPLQAPAIGCNKALQACYDTCAKDYCCDNLPYATHARPSCVMGCQMAMLDGSATTCQSHCAEAMDQCNWKHPNSPEAFQMCVGHSTCDTSCSDGSQCPTCKGDAYTRADECVAGCNAYDFDLLSPDTTEVAPGSWEACQCRDATDFYYKKQSRGCEWIGKTEKRKKKLCKKDGTDGNGNSVGVEVACARTCNNCNRQCVDSTSWFFKESKKNCKWVGKKHLDYRCQKVGKDQGQAMKAEAACPRTCGSCSRRLARFDLPYNVTTPIPATIIV